jgi:hypothetical protein
MKRWARIKKNAPPEMALSDTVAMLPARHLPSLRSSWMEAWRVVQHMGCSSKPLLRQARIQAFE